MRSVRRLLLLGWPPVTSGLVCPFAWPLPDTDNEDNQQDNRRNGHDARNGVAGVGQRTTAGAPARATRRGRLAVVG